MFFQLFLTSLSFYFARSFPLKQYYINNNGQTFLRNFQEDPVFYYPSDFNKPIFIPALNMNSQYSDSIYNYVKDFAGTEQPVHVDTFQPNIYFNKEQLYALENRPVEQENTNFDLIDKIKVQNENKESEITQITDKPGLKNYLLPSDLFSLPNHPSNKVFRHFDSIKIKNINTQAQATSLPPLGGVISNYILNQKQSTTRNLSNAPELVKLNEANLLKRELPNESDSVVIEAEPLQNTKNSEEPVEHKENDSQVNQEDKPDNSDHPAIAQSKPAAIALVGPGGVAQASPLGTALVGKGGLAVAAPSGTAVAGPAGQGALPIVIGEGSQSSKNKKEESDSY